MGTQDVTTYERRGRAIWITLNSPHNRNALSAPLVKELSDHLRAAVADPVARAIVLTGNGPAFCVRREPDHVSPGPPGPD